MENEKKERVEKYNYGRRPPAAPKPKVEENPLDDVQITKDTENLLALADFYLTDSTAPTEKLEPADNAGQPKAKFTTIEPAEQVQTTTSKTTKSKNGSKRNKHGSGYANRREKEKTGKPDGRQKQQSAAQSRNKIQATDKQLNKSAANEVNQSSDKIHSTMPELTRNTAKSKIERSNSDGGNTSTTNTLNTLDLRTPSHRTAPKVKTESHRKPEQKKKKVEPQIGVVSWEEEESLRIMAAERDGAITGLIMVFAMAVVYGIYMLVASYIPSIAPEALAERAATTLLEWIFGLISGAQLCVY